MTEPILLTHTEDRICTITLNRPQARNALSTALGEEIVKAVTAADADENVDVMILTAADPVFCAGVDLRSWAVAIVPSPWTRGGRNWTSRSSAPSTALR